MKTVLSTIMLVGIIVLSAGMASAGQDVYPGDTSIYGGTAPAGVQHNLLLIIDNSGSMSGTIAGEPYDSHLTYTVTNNCNNLDGTTDCKTNWVYNSKVDPPSRHVTGGTYGDIRDVTTTCGKKANPHDNLASVGKYSGRSLLSDGSCGAKGTNGSYKLGNFINWENSSLASRSKMEIAVKAAQDLVQTTHGVRFGLMTFHYPGGTGSASGAQGAEFIEDFTFGPAYETTIKDMDDIFTGTTDNRTALIAAIGTMAPSGYTPLAESLFEAMRYFQGGRSAFGNTVGLTGTPLKYTTPIIASCQKNYIIFLTDGAPTADDDIILKSICPPHGDCDADGKETATDLMHAMDDVAKYLYNNDMADDVATGITGKQNVMTYTIGFQVAASDFAFLTRVSDSWHGHAKAYDAKSAGDVSKAFSAVVAALQEEDTSFVAPVVPVSPENRTYSGSRIYMGFFKPVGGSYWEGNLKKYAIDSDNNIRDKAGNLANYTDLDGDCKDDNDAAIISSCSVTNPLGNGMFRNNAISFWSSAVDGGHVNAGGAGEKLLNNANSGVIRNIYTMASSTGTSVLTDSTNQFSTANGLITAATLSVADATERDKLINFIHGFDSYDENANSVTTDIRSWLFNDVLHAKPLVINYKSYTFTTANEQDCNVNKTIIYISSNDGMLHALKDCDGSEAWAFIPPDVLPDLQEMHTSVHHYYTDSTASSYIYDRNNDRTLDPTDGDRVIIMFGLRRGGGSNTGPTRGFYYALDVSDPANPKYLWKISNNSSPSGVNTDYAELGEAWSEPKIVSMYVGSPAKERVVALIGGGYDNLNEDSRYGNTQSFTGTGTVTITSSGTGSVTSPVTVAPGNPVNPKGRGIYAVEIAWIDTSTPAKAPDFSQSGYKIWGDSWGALISNTTNSYLRFSIPAEVLALDTDFNGYVDKLYVADTGGQLWRADIGDTSTSNWTLNRIFKANPGADGSNGRKVFYKASGIVERVASGDTTIPQVTIYFGTGDREHPQNLNVVDRIYSVIDRQQTTADNIDESDLFDATADTLQSTTIQTGVGSISSLLSQLSATTNYGWFIKLDLQEGEKVLASPTVFNKVLYFTTFSPETLVSADPCIPPKPGTGRLYAVDYKTGEAVMNFYKSNDTLYSALSSPGSGNARAAREGAGSAPNYVLQRADRSKVIGGSIPSGIIMVVNAEGKVDSFAGIGGAIGKTTANTAGAVIQEFWKQR